MSATNENPERIEITERKPDCGAANGSEVPTPRTNELLMQMKLTPEYTKEKETDRERALNLCRRLERELAAHKIEITMLELERRSAQREMKAYQDAFYKQIKVIDAAARVINGTYASWGSAGGAPECPHGYNLGIPCRTCDLNLVKSALEETKAHTGLPNSEPCNRTPQT